MTERYFLDTNVLLYAIDQREPAKQRRACSWLDRLWANSAGAISWQVMHEFYWNATRKFGLAEAFTRAWAEEFLHWQPVDSSSGLIRQAWSWMDAAHIVYWDALIVAAAGIAGARYLLTEDLQAGREFGSVRVVDPFADEGAALLATLS